MRRMTVNLMFWCCLISGFGVRGFRSPEDQVVIVGGQIRMNCSNSTTIVSWRGPNGLLITQAQFVSDDRFNLDLTNGFDLVASNVNASLCGTYTCENLVLGFGASANIAVLDRLPLCRGIGNDSYAEVTCSVSFCGNTSSLSLKLEYENGQSLSSTVGNSTFVSWSGYYNKNISCSAAPGLKSSCNIDSASTTNSAPSTATVSPTKSTASDSMTSSALNLSPGTATVSSTNPSASGSVAPSATNPSSVTATVSSTNPSASGSVAPSATNPSSVTATVSSTNPSASGSVTQSTKAAESSTTMTPPTISSSMVAVAVAVPLAVAVVATAAALTAYALLSSSVPAAAAAAGASGAIVGATRKPFAGVGFYSRKNFDDASVEPANRPYSDYKNPMGYRNSVFNQNSGARYVSRYPVSNGGSDLYAARAFNHLT